MIDDIIVEKIMKSTTADTIDNRIEDFSELVEKMKEAKRKFDLEGLEYNSKPTLKSIDFNDPFFIFPLHYYYYL